MLNRLLCVFMLLVLGVNMSINTDYETNEKLMDYLLNCDNILLYNDNKSYSCDKNQQNSINHSIKEMLKDSHEMPALGVALNNEIRQEIKSGTWIEFRYSNTQEYGGMSFDKLLIKVNEADMGFNIFREHNGLYEGRCYYINLSGDMGILYNTIINITK